MRYLSFVLLSGLLLSACKDKPEKTQPTVEKITESVYASGIIKSKNQYQVYAAVSGLIQQILVSEGDVVKKGDMLPLKVVGVFQSGIADFDKVQSFASIATTQKLLPPPIPMSPTFKSN